MIEIAEQVLGGLLRDQCRFDDVAEIVGPEDFTEAAHRQLWETIASRAREGEPFDPVLLAEVMGTRRRDGALGLAALARLALNAGAPANLLAHARGLREASICRAVAQAGGQIQGLEGAAAERVEAAQRIAAALTDRQDAPGLSPVGQYLPEWLDAIDTRSHASAPLAGMPTGFAELDRMTAGLQPGELVVLAARPSMGKTALALNIADHVAGLRQGAVAFFSLEMPAAQLIDRWVARRARVPLGSLRDPKRLDELHWVALTDMVPQADALPLLIDDSSALTITTLRSRARRAHRAQPLALVIVDYLQLMAGSVKAENRNLEIAEISRGLKALAKDLKLPVIALSQLNRESERRGEQRPRLSDLRESGAIEQDADVVIFVYRDDVVHRDSVHAGKAELIFAKQRNGPIGEVELDFDGALCAFSDASGPSRAERERERPTDHRGKVRTLRGYPDRYAE